MVRKFSQYYSARALQQSMLILTPFILTTPCTNTTKWSARANVDETRKHKLNAVHTVFTLFYLKF